MRERRNTFLSPDYFVLTSCLLHPAQVDDNTHLFTRHQRIKCKANPFLHLTNCSKKREQALNPWRNQCETGDDICWSCACTTTLWAPRIFVNLIVVDLILCAGKKLLLNDTTLSSTEGLEKLLCDFCRNHFSGTHVWTLQHFAPSSHSVHTRDFYDKTHCAPILPFLDSRTCVTPSPDLG